MSKIEVDSLTHTGNNSTDNLVLASNGNVTVAGQLSAGSYSGLPASGVVLKKSYYEIARSTPAGNAFPADDTSPQITEGDEIFSQAYTPSTSSCDLYINTWFHAGEASNISNAVHAGLFISGTNDALQVCSCEAEYYGNEARQINGKIIFIYKMASWGTTEKTFSIRTSGCNGVNYHYIGGFATAQFSAGSSKTGFTIEEVAT
tara:strand:- start:1319 stop:1927 length:609 start_codon:yes stop_codon:yes gene_type:complete